METEKTKESEMNSLSLEIKNCKKCSLWETRNKPLVGDGSINAEILFVGESPGYNEDKLGKAFVGESGKVLDQLLDIVNLKRSEIYITNVLKCHPPKNHSPNKQELESCIHYLHSQIEIIKPKIIITLGKYASQEVFSSFKLDFSKISEVHGKIFEVKTDDRTIKIIPLYHPAVACYHSEMFGILEGDFKKLKDVL